MTFNEETAGEITKARVRNFLKARRDFLGDAADAMLISTLQTSSRHDPLTLTQEDLEILLSLAERA